MRIALYLKHYPASGAPLVGGTATAVHGLASGLAQNGADTIVLCEGLARSSVMTPDGYRVECFPNPGRYRSFRVAHGMAHYVADKLREQPGLCMLHGIFHPACFALGRALRRLGVPYVANPQDPYDRWMFRRNAHLKWPYWYLFERRHLAGASAIQVLDRRHEEPLRRLGIVTPVIETPNGVSPGAAMMPERSRPRLSPHAPPRIVYMGRIDAYNKGLDTLVDAFSRAAALTRRRLTLTLRGPDWGDRAQLERRAAVLGLSERVDFLGPDYTRSPPDILADYDLLCLPSRFEGFGLVALEAMLAGRVLVVSERAGVARHVVASGCGISVPPTVEGVAGGLLALLERRDAWAVMGQRGRRYVLEQLQWKDVAAGALAGYARLLH
jgi:glycosyltransferase involved in cell wall biosynthesis